MGKWMYTGTSEVKIHDHAGNTTYTTNYPPNSKIGQEHTKKTCKKMKQP